MLAAAVTAFLAVSVVAAGGEARAQEEPVEGKDLPRGFSQGKVAGGLSEPTAMAFAPDGRVFVAEQDGRLRVVKNGRLLKRPFVRVATDSRGERGLIGVAVDPDFSRNGYVYLHYTHPGPVVHNRVVRFTARGDTAKPGSRRTIFQMNPLSSAQNHNGGAIHFGAGGKLFVAVGDNANGSNAQTLANLKGKMLRINKDGSIPGDNPFAGRARGKNRAIWALGLRNPFTFGVARGTGKVFINDVGQQTWEEINRGERGANYGWPRFEGPERNRAFAPPVFAYRHSGPKNTSGCAIAGGDFYDPPNPDFPRAYRGDYFFADLCNGWIRKRDAGTGNVRLFATTQPRTVDVRSANDGGLYYLSRGEGASGGVLVRIGYRR